MASSVSPGARSRLATAKTSETRRSSGAMFERFRMASMAQVRGTSMLHRWKGRKSV